MKPSDLGEFIREKTGRELQSQGDGLESMRTDIVIKDVQSPAVEGIRVHISNFYGQNGYIYDEELSDEMGLYYKKPGQTKAVTFSYFQETETVMITAVNIRKGGVADSS